MCFFQIVLLLGYLYAHWAIARWGVKVQAGVHLAILALPLLWLPIALPEGLSPASGWPTSLWLCGVLAVSIGLPFFAVSTTAPVLHRWFVTTRHPRSGDPYFLYAASNLGSMTALLSYPLLIEPVLVLDDQRWAWSLSYLLLLGLVSLCAGLIWWNRAERQPTPPAEQVASESVTWRRRLQWIALSFVPSSWMLAATTLLTTDISPVPLLWVIPLALYLLSFIVSSQR